MSQATEDFKPWSPLECKHRKGVFCRSFWRRMDYRNLVVCLPMAASLDPGCPRRRRIIKEEMADASKGQKEADEDNNQEEAKALIGKRVYAWVEIDDEHQHMVVLGSGVLEEYLHGMIADTNGVAIAGADTPKIRLDTGEVVYGYECWWGAEEDELRFVETFRENGYEIIVTSVEKMRAYQNALAQVVQDAGVK